MDRNPTTFILFGATGDLAVKKIFPALEALHTEGALADMKIVAVSRRDWNDADFREFLAKDGYKYEAVFLDKISYAKVDIDQGIGYEALAPFIEGEPMSYLSLAPQLYPKAVAGLRDAGILARGKGKLLIEKPFGTDEKTADSLNRLVSEFLDDSQVFRIDHYLGKDAIRTVMGLHEGGASLNFILSKETVSSIKVAIKEKIGINGRGAMYDGVGAFRDVGQNHLLEMLAVVAADTGGKDGSQWQSARAEVFKLLAPPSKTCEFSRRGQYEGYKGEAGVREGSETETSFEVITSLTSGKLAGVPLTLAAGKKMPSSEAFIRIDFKDLPGLPARMEFRIQPDQRIIISNRDGSEELFEIRRGRDAYANVILGALKGESRDFVGAEEIRALWSYADHVVRCWGKVPLEAYSDDRPFLIE